MLIKIFLKRIFNEMGMCSQYNVGWEEQSAIMCDFRGVSKTEWRKGHPNVNLTGFKSGLWDWG